MCYLLQSSSIFKKINKKRHEGWRMMKDSRTLGLEFLWVVLGADASRIDAALGKVHDCLWVFTRITTPVGPQSLADLVCHSHAIRIVSVHGYDHECMNMHLYAWMCVENVANFPNLLKQCVTSWPWWAFCLLPPASLLYSNLTQLNFETGAECSQNVAIYRVTKRQTKDDNCENQKKMKRHVGYCWMSDWVKFTHVSCRNASSSRLNRSNQAAKMKQVWWHSPNRVNVLKAHGVWLLCNCQTCCVIFAEL